jgi:hypothetical protein
MSNFEEKFNSWRERMNQKTEKEKHNYALSVAFLLTAVVTFFVVSKWYFLISGENLNKSMFTEIQGFYESQSQTFKNFLN